MARIPRDLYRNLETYATLTGQSITAVVDEARDYWRDFWQAEVIRDENEALYFWWEAAGEIIADGLMERENKRKHKAAGRTKAPVLAFPG